MSNEPSASPKMKMSRRAFTRLGVLTAGVAAAGVPGFVFADRADAITGQNVLNAIPTMSFKHGAALNTTAEINKIKASIRAKQEPQYSNFQKLVTSSLASLDYTPHPVAAVSQGVSGASDVGGFALLTDSEAAYSLALTWLLTGDAVYADKAVSVLNAWSSTLVSIGGANWMLLAAWSGSSAPLAAEMLRGYAGWAAADKARYRDMLNNIYMPILNKRYGFGNREFAVINALLAIGTFNEDRAAFYQGVYHWLSYLPCYIYLTSDGPQPLVADYWVTEPTNDQYYAMHANIFPDPADSWVYQSNAHPPGFGDDQTALVNSYKSGDPTPLWNGMSATAGGWVNGACAETLRDLGHVENSVSEIFAPAELARVQGFDIYSANKTRLAAFMELQSSLRLGGTMPGGYTVVSAQGISPVYETAYNQLANVQHMSLPNTLALVQPLRQAQSYYWIKPAPPGIAATALLEQADYSGGFDTLTHGNLNGASPGQIDLALGLAATASSSQDANHGPGLATDGNPSTAWTSQPSDPQWISVDLGRLYSIDEITLDWATDNAAGYAVQLSADGTDFTSIYTTRQGHGGTVSLNHVGTGRYVRVLGTQRRSASDGYSLAGLSVSGAEVVTPNLALFRPATAAASLNSASQPGNATDGDTTTEWASPIIDNLGHPQQFAWIYVDLGSTHQINGITLLPNAVDYATHYLIQVSDDTVNWTTLYQTTAGTFYTQNVTGLSGAGRYVRMDMTGSSNAGCGLWDFQVYGI